MPAGVGEAETNDEPIGPGLETVDVPEAGQLLPHHDQRPLRGVLGLVRVTGDPVGDRVQPTNGGRREHVEGFAVATLRSFDE